MKILQILPTLNEGGVERGCVDSNREYVKLGHTSVVMSAGGRLVDQIIADGGEHVTFDVASKNIFTVFSRVWKMKKLLQQIAPDVIHARSRVPAWLVWFANKTLRIPFVTTVHGFNSVNPYSRVMTFGDKIICVSGAIKEYIQKNYNVSDEKLVVIPRGIDLVEFYHTSLDHRWSEAFISHFGLNDTFVVSIVGRITQLKDIETFIKAIALVQQDIPRLKGLVLGGVHPDKKEYFKRLQDLVSELALEDVIVFAGHQAHVAEVYSLSDVMVSSSKKPESFGRSAAEALAMNTPVIATRHGGVLDIIQEGKNGYFVEIGNSQELALKIKEASKLHFDGYEYIKENFSLDQMVEKTLRVYESMRTEK